MGRNHIQGLLLHTPLVSSVVPCCQDDDALASSLQRFQPKPLIGSLHLSSLQTRYRGTSIIRNSAPREPYRRNVASALWQPSGGGLFLMSEVTCTQTRSESGTPWNLSSQIRGRRTIPLGSWAWRTSSSFSSFGSVGGGCSFFRSLQSHSPCCKEPSTCPIPPCWESELALARIERNALRALLAGCRRSSPLRGKQQRKTRMRTGPSLRRKDPSCDVLSLNSGLGETGGFKLLALKAEQRLQYHNF